MTFFSHIFMTSCIFTNKHLYNLMILIVLEVLIMLFDYSLYDTLNSLLHIPYENGFLICYMTKSSEKYNFCRLMIHQSLS